MNMLIFDSEMRFSGASRLLENTHHDVAVFFTRRIKRSAHLNPVIGQLDTNLPIGAEETLVNL